MGGQHSQAATYLCPVQCTAHAERIQPPLGVDAKVVRQDEPIEHSVMG